MGGYRVVVLGGAGAMGRVTVRDLFETSDAEIVVADFQADRARELAAPPRVTAVPADVTDPAATRSLLKGAFAVVNAVQYHHNLAVMQAALEVGAHYVDLGGLFHVTRRQLELHEAFERRGLLALLGMGAAPGTTNLLARVAADELDEVREIHVRVASASLEPTAPTLLETGYSLQTVLEEGALPAAVVRRGRLEFVQPLSPAGEGDFPPPVGPCDPVLTLHSEVATLPARYPGLQECTFGIDFGAELTGKLRFLRDLGLNSREPVQVGGETVIPQDLLLALLRRRPRNPAPERPPRQHEVLRALARGLRRGREAEVLADCHVTDRPDWGMGLEVDTGCPPSVAVQMLARGEITARGALAPEDAVPPAPYFRELERRGMRLVTAGPAHPSA